MNTFEQALFAINIPSFLINFKEKVLSYIIPTIESIITYLENADDVVIVLLLILIFVQILRTLLIKISTNTLQEHSSNTSENRQISKQVKDLKKQLKSIQTMLNQLKSIKIIEKPKSSIGSQQTNKIIKLCKESWQKRSEITEEILDWQLKIIKQVTKMKNKVRSSRSPNKNNPPSSQHISAQSKKSINSMMISSQHKTIQPSRQLFTSQIKAKEVIVVPVEEVSQSVTAQSAAIEIQFYNQAINGTHRPSINVSVHEFKKQKENIIVENYQSVQINPPNSLVIPQVKEQKSQSQQIIIPEIIKAAPSLPRPPVSLPRPPTNIKKDTKRPPPLFKTSAPSTDL